MPTTATVTGNPWAGQTLTCTLTGYASDILTYTWQYLVPSGYLDYVTHGASSVTDDTDTFVVPGDLVGKEIRCVAVLDGEGERPSNRVGPVRGGSGASARRGKPQVIVRNHDAIARKVARSKAGTGTEEADAAVRGRR